jgi:hypothetical protein
VKPWKNRLPEKRLCKRCRIWNDVFIGFRYLCSYWNDRSVDSLSVFHLGDNNLGSTHMSWVCLIFLKYCIKNNKMIHISVLLKIT